jgi:hypothetical protein
LSRVRSFFVIARNSSFTYKGRAVDVRQVARELGVRYVLEGSVQRGSSRVRVSAQLLDADDGTHLWADRFDRPLQDLFALQDEVTMPSPGPSDRPSPMPSSAGHCESHRGVLALGRHTSGVCGIFRAASWKMFRAHENSSTMPSNWTPLAAAHTGLAELCTREGDLFASRPLVEALALGADEARKTVEIDPTDADAHAYLAGALGGIGDHTSGFDHVGRALSINPSCAPAYYAKGWLLLFSGRPAEGREAILFAMRLDPHSAFNVALRSNIAMSYYFEGDYENAVASARRLLADCPDHPWVSRCA